MGKSNAFNKKNLSEKIVKVETLFWYQALGWSRQLSATSQPSHDVSNHTIIRQLEPPTKLIPLNVMNILGEWTFGW